MASDGIKVIAKNRKAHHDYFIEETYEAGIVLTGTEVKSIRLGKVNLKDSYADVKQGEVYLHNMHISLREGNIFNSDLPEIKLLLNRRKSTSTSVISSKGYSLIPLQIYLARVGQGAAGGCQRQEAVRQAQRCGKARCAQHGACLQRTAESLMCLHGGVLVSTGMIEVRERVATPGPRKNRTQNKRQR